MTRTHRIVLILMLFLFSDALVNAQCLKPSEPSDISVEEINPAEKLAEQGIDTTNNLAVLKALKDSSLVISVYSSKFFAKHGYKPAVADILDRYKRAGGAGRLSLIFLESLERLGYSTEGLFVDFANKSYQDLPSTGFAYRRSVMHLFKIQNYSQIDNIIGLIKKNVNSEQGANGYLYTLSCAFDATPYRDEIINTLVFMLKNYKDPETRMMVPLYAKDFPNSKKLKQSLRETAVEDNVYEVRKEALIALQHIYQDPSSLDLVMTNINRTSLSSEIEDYLNTIYTFHTPKSLFDIKKLKDESSNQIVRGKANQIYENYWWLYFAPYGKAFNYSQYRDLDSLNAYTQDVASYDWLGDRNFVKELTNRLDNAGRHLARRDSTNAAKEINDYMKRLKKVYQKQDNSHSPRFVTKDGYKFLYNNAEYLLSQLPGYPSGKR